MTDPTCKTCKHMTMIDVDNTPEQWMACYRYPQPVDVNSAHWCGEHTPHTPRTGPIPA